MSIIIIYSSDPRGNKIGGIETHVLDYLKYGPEDVKFVGIDTVGDLVIGKWSKIDFYGKKILFFPVLFEPTTFVNIQRKIPLTLRFVLKLFIYKNKIVTHNDMLDFQRQEHIIPFIFPKKNNRIFQFIHGSSEHLFIKTGTTVEKYRLIFIFIEKFILRYCDRIFLVSPEGYNFYKKKYSYLQDRFIQHSSSVDPNVFYPLPKQQAKFRESFAIPANAKVIAFAGRVQGVKDPQLLFEVFKKTIDLDPNVILCIAGPGRLEDFISTGNEERYFKKVIQVGILNATQLNEFYNCADTFLLTSKYEGMPRCVLEAMCVGIPVVTVIVGSVRMLIKSDFNGYLVESRKPTDIAEAVMKSFKAHSILSLNAIKSIEKFYSKIVISNLVEHQLNTK